MAITLTSVSQQAACNAVVDQLDSAAGTLRIRSSTTTLCDLTLPAPAFGAANASGVAQALGLPITATCSNSGLADNYQVLNNGGTVLWSGVITGQAGAGDLILDNPSLITGQVLSLSTWSHSQPASG